MLPGFARYKHQMSAHAYVDKVVAGEGVGRLKRMGQARGTTTLLVTHDPRILDSADRILTLEDGRIIRVEDRS